MTPCTTCGSGIDFKPPWACERRAQVADAVTGSGPVITPYEFIAWLKDVIRESTSVRDEQ